MSDYSDPEVVLQLGQPDPELIEYLENHHIRVPQAENVLDMRMMRNKIEKDAGGRFHSETKVLTMRDGYESEIRIFKPASGPQQPGSPLVVLIHGGGFTFGTNSQLSLFATALVTLYGATAVNISYRLAPEHIFPVALNDAWDTLKWLRENAQSLGADPNAGFILGGNSAGGNLSAVIAQRAHDEGLSPPLTGLWLCAPLLLDEAIVPLEYAPVFLSRDQAFHGPFADATSVARVYKLVKPDIRSLDWSPFNSATAHWGLPPTYIQVCGNDPMRDDGLIYERALKAAGVKTRLDIYPGLPHMFFRLFPALKSSQKAVADVVEGLGWLIGKEVSRTKIEKVMMELDRVSKLGE